MLDSNQNEFAKAYAASIERVIFSDIDPSVRPESPLGKEILHLRSIRGRLHGEKLRLMLHEWGINAAANLDGSMDQRNVAIQEVLCDSRVLCVSELHDNVVMWSHYADHHKGVCFEFNGSMDPEDILLRRGDMIANVNYDRTETINYHLDERAAVLDLFTRKWQEWRYEEEVRIIIMEEGQYHQFNRSFLTGVSFGCRTAQGDKQRVLEALAANAYNVALQEAVRTKSKLEFQPVTL